MNINMNKQNKLIINNVNELEILDKLIQNEKNVNNILKHIDEINSSNLYYMITKCLEINNKILCFSLLEYYFSYFLFELNSRDFYFTRKNKPLGICHVYTFNDVVNWAYSI